MSFVYQQRTFERLKARLLSIPNESVSIEPPRVDFLPSATAQQRTDGNALANGHATLTLQTNKVRITANDTDTATITLSTLSNVDYKVYASDGVVDFQGTLVPSAGVVTLAFKTPLPESYLIEFMQGNATGYLEIKAV